MSEPGVYVVRHEKMALLSGIPCRSPVVPSSSSPLGCKWSEEIDPTSNSLYYMT